MKESIDFGLESVQQAEAAGAEEAYTAEDALDLMEAALLLDGEVADLAGVLRFVGNSQAVAASVKENGIDAGTEALFGQGMKGYFEKWDAEDAEGTATAIEAGLEGVGEKIAAAVRKIVERIRQFLEKLFLNQKGLMKEYQIQKLRLNGMKNYTWKKGDKVFSLPGTLDKAKAAGIVETANEIVKALDDTEFKIDGKVKPEFLNGAVLKTLREAAGKTTEFKCASSKPESVWKDLLGDVEGALNMATELDSVYKTVKSIQVKSLEEATGNKVPPAKAASTAASIVSFTGIYQLKVARAKLAILKNIK